MATQALTLAWVLPRNTCTSLASMEPPPATPHSPCHLNGWGGGGACCPGKWKQLQEEMVKSFRNRCQCQQPNEPVIQGYAGRLEPNSFMLGQFCVHGLVGFRHRNHSGKVRKTVPTTGKFVPTCHKPSWTNISLKFPVVWRVAETQSQTVVAGLAAVLLRCTRTTNPSTSQHDGQLSLHVRWMWSDTYCGNVSDEM